MFLLQAAAETCDASEKCKGFQLCFRSTAQSSVSSARIRLKGAIAGPLNLTTAMFNPYCRCSPLPFFPHPYFLIHFAPWVDRRVLNVTFSLYMAPP